MSTPRRRLKSVYDLTSLRLHPSDVRVLPDHLSAPESSLAQIASSSAVTLQDLDDIAPSDNIPIKTNKRHRKPVVQTGPRAEWVAADVGGAIPALAKRPVAYTALDPISDGEDELESDEEVVSGEEHPEGTRKRPRRKKKKKTHGKRKTKRRRLDADLDYDYVDSDPSTPPPPPPASTLPPISQSKLPTQRRPLPSSDLLKMIHHFAATLWHARGQMKDVPRAARKERKIRHEAKLAAKAAIASQGHEEDETEHIQGEDDASEANVRAENQQPEAGPITDQVGIEVPATILSQDVLPTFGTDTHSTQIPQAKPHVHWMLPKPGRPKLHERPIHGVDRDMYRALDGSALICLGMLFEECVADMVKGNLPLEGEDGDGGKIDEENEEDWEEEEEDGDELEVEDWHDELMRRAMLLEDSLPEVDEDEEPEAVKEDSEDEQKYGEEDSETEEEDQEE